MGVYVDIDADFMFRPRTGGNPRTRQDRWITPMELVGRLLEAGLDWSASPVVVFTDHKEAYFVWKEWGVRLATLVHVDAHSDFYDTFPWLVHCGNFLRKAVEDRMFSKVVWVAPRWLYDSGEWARLDMDGVRLRARRSASSHHDTGCWHCRGGHEVRVEIVPHDRFVMPNSRVVLVTVATSPAFVPPNALDRTKELVETIAARGRGLAVRPHIPISIEDAVLRALWRDVRDEAGCRQAYQGGKPTNRSEGRRQLSYLWAEHAVLQRCRCETRGPGAPGGGGARAGGARAAAVLRASCSRAS